jgi:hypothetical protein
VEQDRRNVTGRWDRHNRKGSMGQVEQDRQNWTCRTGLTDKTARTIARKGLPGQDYHDKLSRLWLPAYYC